MSRPELDKSPNLNSFENLPLGTYGKGLMLTETFEGWRNETPIIDTEKCVMCNICYLVCPEGVVYQEDNKMKIDYRFCKGCGICAKECKPGCIAMKEEV